MIFPDEFGVISCRLAQNSALVETTFNSREKQPRKENKENWKCLFWLQPAVTTIREEGECVLRKKLGTLLYRFLFFSGCLCLSITLASYQTSALTKEKRASALETPYSGHLHYQVKTRLSCNTPYRRSITASVETNPLYSRSLNKFSWSGLKEMYSEEYRENGYWCNSVKGWQSMSRYRLKTNDEWKISKDTSVIIGLAVFYVMFFYYILLFFFFECLFDSATCVVYVISVLESFKTTVARDYKLNSVFDLFSALISRRILSKSQ